VFASVRVRRLVCLPFIMQDELLTNLMPSAVAALRNGKEENLVKA